MEKKNADEVTGDSPSNVSNTTDGDFTDLQFPTGTPEYDAFSTPLCRLTCLDVRKEQCYLDTYPSPSYGLVTGIFSFFLNGMDGS